MYTSGSLGTTQAGSPAWSIHVHIEILENGTIVTDEIQVVNILNTYFAKSGNVNNITDTVILPIERTIIRHKQHPSISRFQDNYGNPAS